MKPVRTLIVIADDQSARLLVNEGVGKGLREVAVLSRSQFPEDSREYSDRPGRSSLVAGAMARHGLDRHTELEQQHRRRFAGHISDALDQAWTTIKPERMILAAPAKMLGELRGRLSSAPARGLVADLPKNLVSVPLRDLAAHFADHLVI